MQKELLNIISAIKKHIELEELAGTGYHRLTDRVGPLAVKTANGPTRSVRRSTQTSLETLRQEVLSCTKCELSETRTHVVFGAGNPKARLMFVGEAPGRDEDLQGLPFVGRAGELLTKIIESIGLKRKDVYIANILKCRPPNNRNPFPAEILTCESYLVRQIELIRPKVICALGKFAAQTLLRSEVSITRLRGKFYNYHETKVIPTFHPAYLLRNPGEKRAVWEDMKKIQRELRG